MEAMTMYAVTLQSDKGRVIYKTADRDGQTAAKRICEAVGAPYPTAVVKTAPVRPTVSELAHKVGLGQDSQFFTPKTMRFFGDTMRNYKVSGPVDVRRYSGETVECWELERRKPVKGGLNSSAFFSIHDFRRIIPAKP
jgi:hypothetical protein